MKLTFLTFATYTLLGAAPLLAQDCQRATPPACALETGGFNDQTAVDSCRDEINDYFAAVRLFSQCKREEIQKFTQATRKVTLEVNDEVRNTSRLFNCRLRGDSECQ